MYLITGGAGFIGSNLAEALVRDGERVRILDNFSSGTLDNLAAVRDRVEIVEGDLRDYDAVQRAMQGVTYVSHQAALRSVERSVDDPLSSDEVNVHGTLHVLMAARETPGGQARGLRLVVVGVRRESDPAEDRRTRRRRRSRPTRCRSSRPRTTAACSASSTALETVSLRYFNVFGPQAEPGVEVRRGHPALHARGAAATSRSRSTATASSRATSPTSTTSCRPIGWR